MEGKPDSALSANKNLPAICRDFIKHVCEYATADYDIYECRDFALKRIVDHYKVDRFELIMIFESITSAGEWSVDTEVIFTDGDLYKCLFVWSQGDTCPRCYTSKVYPDDE